MYGYESWIKESWALKNWYFWTVALEKTLESPLDCKEIQPVHPKGNQSWIFIGRTDAEVETPILWPPDAKNWLTGKDPDERLKAGGEGLTEDKMVGWHHRLNGHEFEQAPGVGDGQGSLACCSPWGCKESDTTEWPNWTEWFKSNLKDQRGFLGGSAGKESTCDAGDPGLIPGLGRSPRRREWLPTPVFWPGEFRGLYSPWGCKESGMTDQLSLSRTNTGTHKLTVLYVVCQVHITWTWITWQFDYCKGVKYLATQKQVKFCKWKLELIHKYTDFHTEVWKKLGLRLSCSGHTGSFVSDQWSFP